MASYAVGAAEVRATRFKERYQSKNTDMKIAIPVENGRLHSHFGGSRHFALIEVDENTKTLLRSETLPAPEHQPGVFPRWLRDQGAQVVIAGGIGPRALALFAQQGVRVVAGQPDAPVDVLVNAYLAGQLVQTPEGCAHHHEHHEHGQPGAMH
jgi:predicted Fe-Mo cluster-binding NifX family protein